MAAEKQRGSINEALTAGLALQQAGKLGEAEAIYRKVLETAPDHPDALHLLGIARRQSGEPKEAIELISRAIAVNGGHAGYVSNLGTAFEAAGQLQQALAAYRRAIKMKPDFAEAYHKLGMLLQRSGKHEQAEVALKRAVALRPEATDWLLALGATLFTLKRFPQAAVVLARAVELKPDFAEAHYQLGNALLALKRQDEALACHRRAAEIKPDHDGALFSLSCIMLERGDAQGLAEECERGLARDPGNRRVVSSKIVALAELGRRDEARALLDFERFLRPFEFAAPEGYADVAAFNAALTEAVRSHPSLVFEKAGHATKFGGHTANILIDPSPPVAALEKLMSRAVEDYAARLKGDPGHPVFVAKPERWKLQAWAVVMDIQGHQLPHIHPAAWLSGVYYVKIPVSDPKPRDPHAGWIEFGRPQENMRAKAEPDLRLYRPKEGLMLLFPSYFYHLTIPIETKEQRISIAFDVVAEGAAGGTPY